MSAAGWQALPSSPSPWTQASGVHTIPRGEPTLPLNAAQCLSKMHFRLSSRSQEVWEQWRMHDANRRSEGTLFS